MDFYLLLLCCVVCFFLFFMIFAVKIVSQASEYVVERLGSYHKTLKPGFNIIIPIIDYVSSQVSMKETVLNVKKQEVISRDNASLQVDGVAFFQVMDSKKVTYVINDLFLALENLIVTNVRTVMGGIDLDEMLSNRDFINSKLLSVLNEATNPWGVRIVRVEIKDITPPKDLLNAMAQQMKAEREKRAVVLQAEGVRQSEILQAEGQKQAQILLAEAQKEKHILEAIGIKEAQFRQAESRERLAQAEAFATKQMSEAISNGDIKALQYFVSQKYIESISKLATSSNTKTIMMPLELSNFISSLSGIHDLLKSE